MQAQNHFSLHFISLLLGLGIITNACPLSGQSIDQPFPNIIYILVDDLG